MKHRPVSFLSLVFILACSTITHGESGFTRHYNQLKEHILGMSREGLKTHDREQAARSLEGLELARQRLDEELNEEKRTHAIVKELKSSAASSQHSPQNIHKAEEITLRNQRSLAEIIAITDEEIIKLKNHMKSLKPASLDSGDFMQTNK